MDVAAEMEKALAQFMPRAGDYVFLTESTIIDDPFEAVIEVSDGRAFVVALVDLSGGTQVQVSSDDKEGQPLWPAAGDEFDLVTRPRHVLLPGDSLEVGGGSGGGSVRIWGYWLDYDAPEK